MLTMIKLLVILYSLINLSQCSRVNCNQSCASKTYYLSTSYKTNCSIHDCLVKGVVTVIEQDHFVEYLNLTLVGYNVGESDRRSIAYSLIGSDSSNVTYSCVKLESGLTYGTVNHLTGSGYNVSFNVGSTIYMNGNLYCTWIMGKSDPFWPIDWSASKADLINDHNYAISLSSDNRSISVAENSSELPIYQMKFIDCCGYKRYGSEDFLLITKKNANSTDFLLQVIGKAPGSVKVSLNNTNNVSVSVECNFAGNWFKGQVKLGSIESTITRQFLFHNVTDNRCSWTLPSIIDNILTLLQTKKSSNELQISADDVVVFSQPDFNLTNSSIRLTISSLIIGIFISVLFTAS